MKWLGPSLIKDILLSNLKRLPEPYKITFSVTSRCNSRCKTCNIWKKDSVEELSSGEIGRIFRNTGAKWINLTGGEVFMRNDILDIAETVRRDNPSLFNITTNGFMTDRIVSAVKGIMGMGFPKFLVVISIDGPERVHDEIRGIKGAWRRAIETYKRLKRLSMESDLDVFIGYTISEYNLGYLMETYNDIKALLPDTRREDFHFNMFHISPHYYSNDNNGNDILNHSNELIDEIGVANKMRPSGFSPITFGERSYMKYLRNRATGERVPLRCASLHSSCFIDHTGNVYPCIHFDRKIGNLRESDYDLKVIWNSGKAMTTRNKIRRNKCPGCWTPCEAYQTILANLPRFRL